MWVVVSCRVAMGIIQWKVLHSIPGSQGWGAGLYSLKPWEVRCLSGDISDLWNLHYILEFELWKLNYGIQQPEKNLYFKGCWIPGKNTGNFHILAPIPLFPVCLLWKFCQDGAGHGGCGQKRLTWLGCGWQSHPEEPSVEVKILARWKHKFASSRQNIRTI